MKKNCDSGHLYDRWRKILLIMKLTTIIIFVLFMQVSAEVYSQKNDVTLSLDQVNLSQVFKEIKRQTGYTFVYNEKAVDKASDLSVNFNNATLTQVLETCLKGTRLGYRISGNVVVIISKDKAMENQGQQVQSINGKVTDERGIPLPGVTVVIKGTQTGISTDLNGVFKLEIPKQEKVVLVFSFVGMKTKEVLYKGQDNISVVMEEEAAAIEEVVITGIFKKAKSTFTGSATVVTSEELQRNGSRNLIATLANIDPALHLVENNELGSNPNSLPEIQIRGNSSVPNVSEVQDQTRVSLNTPLVILDGFESSLEKLLDIDENDVESITILKDASATSIYGSRGANGVIVINTKAPEKGKLRVTYSSKISIEAPDLSSYSLLNAREKLEAEVMGGLWNTTSQEKLQQYNVFLNDINSGVNTDWMAQPLRTGVGGRHSIRLEGGDSVFRYAASLQYNDVQGVMKESFRKTINGTIKLSYTYKNLKFSNNLMLGFNKNSESPYGAFSDYVTMNPYHKPYDEFGNVIKEYMISQDGYIRIVGNPLYNSLLNTYNKSKYTSIVNNFSIEWQILPELSARGRVGFSTKTNQNDIFKPAEHTEFSEYKDEDVFRKGSYSYGTGESTSYDASFTINYSKTFNEKHNVYIGVDCNIRQNEGFNYRFIAEGFSNQDFDFLPIGLQYKQGTKPGGSESKTRSAGFTANANYSYTNKYFVDISGRMDGASQFGASKRFAPFWSTGIGWNIHKEDFLKNNEVVSFLKLKASTGMTGSQSFSAYQALSTYHYVMDKRYYDWMGAQMMGLGNEDLKWQQKNNYNAGFELKLFSNRISLNGDIYSEVTKDLVSSVNIPRANGFISYIENIGEMKNTGYELKLSGFIIRNTEKDMIWSVSTALMHNKNKITSLSQALLDAQKELEEDDGANPNMLYRPGYSTNTIWAVKSLGIDPSNGKEVYVDRNGNPTYTWDARDIVDCGIASPKFNGNLSSMFKVGDFSANISFGYRFGGQLYNSTLINKVENADLGRNVDSRVLNDRWKKPGDIAAFKSITITDATSKTSRFVEDESTLRCQNLSLQYRTNSPKVKQYLGLDRLILDFSTSDLFYISTVKRERGTSYPFSRQFLFSITAVL